MKQTLLTILLFISFTAFSQEMITITGCVRDCLGEPAIGGTVYAIKNRFDDRSNNYVTTDIDGNYTITAKSNEYLLFRYLGAESKVVEIRGRRQIDVDLEEDWPDFGLPHEYYIDPMVSITGNLALHNDNWGYAMGAQVSLPWWSSERYDRGVYKKYNKWARNKYGLYNKIKRHSSIGINLTKRMRSGHKLLPSIYYQVDYPIAIKKYHYGIRPFVRVGLYLDVDRREIQSQNLEYGGGILFWGGRIPYTNWLIGYQAFNKRSEYNNFYIGFRFTFPGIPRIYY